MSNSLITDLEAVLSSTRILINEAVRERVFHIWKMDESLQAKAVLLPESTEEVSAIMKICHQYNQPVVVHGGLTGLVGSTEANLDEVVISIERMNRIEEVDEKSRTMTVQAGVILENIHDAANGKSMLFPLNYGAKGSAQIGGAISTNAGGLRVFRFGMTRNLVLGLEAVLADGTIISSMKKIIKDNSAYDLKQLFIGSEGTLGIVTRAVLKLVESPKSRTTAIVAMNNYDKVVDFLKFMDSGLAGTLSGFELMWKPAYQALTSPPATSPPPLTYDYNYYVLIEGLGSNQEQDQSRMFSLLEEALEKGIIADAAPAQSGSDVELFWKIREDVDGIVSQCRNDQHFDISLPIPLIGDFIEEVVKKLYELPEVEKVFCFGHVADGNIHLIISKSIQSDALIKQINDIIYLPLKPIGGSVSAEHGIGVHKKPYLSISRNEAEIQLMQALKQTMDPKKILNRNKVVD